MNPIKRRRSPFILFLLLVLWSAILGLGLAQAALPRGESPNLAAIERVESGTVESGTVDIVPANFQLGQEVYLENCTSCHVGLPPAILPSQTWRSLIQDAQHYGAIIPTIQEPLRQVAWNYLSTYSRPLNKGEEVPFRIGKSRFFKALHPKVDFAEPVTLNSCIICHPASAQFNYRSLSPEWIDSP
ncbi:MAG: diheme cytochrome C [Leptolyngbyaceae cyanobacterium CSU_1_4]|nr:diheme cytochrome C [Leptolyngbyaceae cyanobacterium CSU_1_4]